jgi:hypothetical protein
MQSLFSLTNIVFLSSLFLMLLRVGFSHGAIFIFYKPSMGVPPPMYDILSMFCIPGSGQLSLTSEF